MIIRLLAAIAILIHAPLARAQQLSDRETVQALKTILADTRMNKYGYCLVLLPKNIDIRSSNIADLKTISESKTFRYYPYQKDEKDISINLSVMPTLYEKVPERSLFVTIEGIGGKVPVEIAEQFAAAFASGFTSRITLGELLNGLSGSVDVSSSDLDFLATEKDVLRMKVFEEPATFKNVMNLNDYDHVIVNNMEVVNVELAGMIWGWQAGIEMSNLKKTESDVWAAGLALCKSRFTPRNTGRTVAYTLNYLDGYSQILKIRENIKGVPISDLGAALKSATSDLDAPKAAGRMSNLLFEILVRAYADMPQEGAQSSQRTNLRELISGWLIGSQDLSSTMLRDLFALSYAAGYQSGYKTGYEKGFDDGYKDGLIAGKDKAISDANQHIAALEGKLSKLKSAGWKSAAGGFVSGLVSGLVSLFS